MASRNIRSRALAWPTPHRLPHPEPAIDGISLMNAVEEELKTVVERRHDKTARLAYIDAVSIAVPGRSVWTGIVLVFDLDGPFETGRAYAWFSSERGAARHAHVVLHGPSAQSAGEAVMAVLAAPNQEIKPAWDARDLGTYEISREKFSHHP